MLNLTCAICTELFAQSDNVHATHCGHLFHFVCLAQWMERSKTCPQCRHKCGERNLTRLYFNIANLDTSRIDVGSLQEQLDNANLQLKLKDTELRKAEDKVAHLQEIQRMCKQTISGLENKVKSNEFVILTYAEQVKMLKLDAKMVEELRKEVKTLKEQIATLESVGALVSASKAEVEKMLQNESNPHKLCTWVMTLKRELRLSEGKRNDIRNVLKVVQNDLRREIELRKEREERISQLESENYQLSEKVKALEAAESERTSTCARNAKATSPGKSPLYNPLLKPLAQGDMRFSISPTIKENVKQIEESNSPYFNIKSSSVGLMPLFKSNSEASARNTITKSTSIKLTTLRISPQKREANGGEKASSSGLTAGAVRKTASDLSEKYSIFKKPRLGTLALPLPSSVSLRPNYVYNGLGGSERLPNFGDTLPTVRDSPPVPKKGPSTSTTNPLRFKTLKQKTDK